MKISILLLLVSFNVINFMNLGDSYTISIFIETLKAEGMYDLIIDITCIWGRDVAIEFCFLYSRDPGCEQLVNVYLPRDEKVQERMSSSGSTSSSSIGHGSKNSTDQTQKKDEEISDIERKKNYQKLKKMLESASKLHGSSKYKIAQKIKEKFQEIFL